jgi:xylan 1,4-beta-xylosidase
MRGGQVSAGTYTPTIRYHNSIFYVVCTFVGGIDPSFFFDNDGKCYVTNCDEPVGQVKYNGHRTIRLQEVDLEQMKPVGEKTVLVDGGTDISKRPVWCEGPHLYKINNTYYLKCLHIL